MKKSQARIISKKKLCDGIYDIRMETDLVRKARCGQFVLVFPNDPSRLLGRPLCICGAGEEELRIVFRISGEGTGQFARLEAGDRIMVEGPLGNGWDMTEAAAKDVLLLCGGIGAPALLELSKKLCGSEINAGGPKSVTAILGYRDASMKEFLAGDFKESGAKVIIATDDGSCGIKGNVIDAAKEKAVNADIIYACGPMPMLKAVGEYAGQKGIEAFISLEERMACGVGACLGCVVRTKNTDGHSHVKNARICTEGPVFKASEVVL